ncbi:hypothetical protein [Sphingosinithalassobacter sp. CS137]|uniref:hypothetical protein n=1 Tax=Sphingosinithalassobacter sp. CS137 TaxID=2762748 RepID=UPI00165EB7AF|nr:hypothetical protein [Sphingosinithalassobacter sp. CS137]
MNFKDFIRTTQITSPANRPLAAAFAPRHAGYFTPKAPAPRVRPVAKVPAHACAVARAAVLEVLG